MPIISFTVRKEVVTELTTIAKAEGFRDVKALVIASLNEKRATYRKNLIMRDAEVKAAVITPSELGGLT